MTSPVVLFQAATMAAAWLVVVCAFADAAFPQPRPGSRWTPIRKVITALGVNIGWAKNAIEPGSLQATVTALDVMRLVEQTHTEANVSRSALSDQIAASMRP